MRLWWIPDDLLVGEREIEPVGSQIEKSSNNNPPEARFKATSLVSGNISDSPHEFIATSILVLACFVTG